MAHYTVKYISIAEKNKILSKIKLNEVYQLKANIYGICVKLFTDSNMFKDMWLNNFEQMPEQIHPHVRIYNINKGKKLEVLYEKTTKTIIIKNCDYYGWIKSIALGLANEYMEDVPSEHRRYSIHGSCVDYKGRGIGLIGVSGAGKTTLTYGLLLKEGFSYVSDDWFFVRLKDKDAMAFSSERNSYLRDGLEKDWPEYKKRIDAIHPQKDNKKRYIADVRRLFGDDNVLEDTNLRAMVILTRDKKLPPFKQLTKKEMVDFLMKNGFCNPHQILKTKAKIQMRKKFFMELYDRVPFFLLNTIETPKESLERLINVWRKYLE